MSSNVDSLDTCRHSRQRRSNSTRLDRNPGSWWNGIRHESERLKEKTWTNHDKSCVACFWGMEDKKHVSSNGAPSSSRANLKSCKVGAPRGASSWLGFAAIMVLRFEEYVEINETHNGL